MGWRLIVFPEKRDRTSSPTGRRRKGQSLYIRGEKVPKTSAPNLQEGERKEKKR